MVHKKGAIAYEHTKYLPKEMGSRVYGTQGEAEAKNYIKQQFEEWVMNHLYSLLLLQEEIKNYSSAIVIAFKAGMSSNQDIVGALYDSVAAGKRGR